MTSTTASPARRRTIALGFAGLGLLSLAGCALESASAGSSGSSTTSGASSGAPSGTSAGSSAYSDGAYTAEASYEAPSGLESVAVELTLVDGVITSVSTSADSSDRQAAHFQSMFARAISGSVVGRDISSLSVTRVAGASLTSNGFNTALDQIRAQAHA